MRPKSGVAVWMMAVLLVAAALGGIAFFAVKRGNATQDPGTNGGSDPGIPATAVTSAAPPPPQPTSMVPSTAVTTPSGPTVETNAGTVALGKDAAAGTPTPPVVTPTPPARPAGAFPWRPGNGSGGGHAPRNPGRPAPPTTSDPQPPAPPARPPQPNDPPKPTPPGLAPDPFGTPE
jgi:hypothetical protein